MEVLIAHTGTNLKRHFRKAGVIRVGPITTYLKEGLKTEEVLRLLGAPTSISERNENGYVVTIYEFPRGGKRVLLAEFADDTLIGSRIEIREQIAQTKR